MEKTLLPEQSEDLLKILKTRFEKFPDRHAGVEWISVEGRLKKNPGALWSLNEMERTGGEPDVVGYDESTGQYLFYDCAAESPKGRRSLCYDRESLESRKDYPPAGSALEMAEAMGIEVLDETEYRTLQAFGHFDAKTSSWLKTPDDIRELGGAVFGDYRYGTVFLYHNGASSYYAARGFRGKLLV